MEYMLELKRIAFGPDTSTRDRLSAIKELLKLEPSASKQGTPGAIYHVYAGGTRRDESVASRGEHGEEVSQG